MVLASTTMYPAIAPNLRCVGLLVQRDLGHVSEARAEFERVAAHGFSDLPPNVARLWSIAFLAEACVLLNDAVRASTLYELLLPFANRNVSIGPVVACGSVSRQLALLADLMGRQEEAERHFEDALARTQLGYADLLLTRDGAGDRAKGLGLLREALEIARELGMTLVVERALAVKLYAQGVARSSLEASIDVVASVVQRDRPDLRGHIAPDGTVTIRFTDIEGSTAMTERLGDRPAQAILRTHNAIVRHAIAAHGGFEVKSQGDAS